MRARIRQWAKWLLTGFVLSRAAGVHAPRSLPGPSLQSAEDMLYAQLDQHINNLIIVKALLITYPTHRER